MVTCVRDLAIACVSLGPFIVMSEIQSTNVIITLTLVPRKLQVNGLDSNRVLMSVGELGCRLRLNVVCLHVQYLSVDTRLGDCSLGLLVGALFFAYQAYSPD